MHRIRMAAGALLSLLSARCGAHEDGATDGSGVGVTTLEFGESSCRAQLAPVDAVLNFDFGGDSTQSPTTYSNPRCTKSWLVQASNAFPAGVGGEMTWAHMWDRNRTQCEGGMLRLQILSAATIEPYRNDGTYTFPLYWDPGQQACWYPFVYFEHYDGLTYFFAAYFAGRPVGGPIPDIPENLERVVVPNELTGRKVRIAAQNLTPNGSTQPIRIRMWYNGPPR